MAKIDARDMDFDPKKLELTDIDNITPNTWNPKQKNTSDYEKVKKSIEQKGLRGAIVVRQNSDGKFEIIDGEQRYTAAKELGYKQMYVYNEGTEVSDDEAEALTIWYQQQVPFDNVELAPLVLRLTDLGHDLPFDEMQMKEFETLVHFDFNDYEDKIDYSNEQYDVKTLVIKMQADKYEVVMRAIDKVREELTCDEARAIELICAEYMS